MKKNVVSRKLISAVKTILPVFLVIIVVCGVVVFGIRNAGERSTSEEKRLAEETICRAVITCYAIEGSYPPSYEYIKENYGLRIDESKYSVIYSIFASNIMPDITVLER